MRKNLLFMVAFVFMAMLGNSQTVLFEDDFESGVADWELTGDWGTTDTQSNSPSNSMTDSPDGNYAADLDTYCTMANGVDLSTEGILSSEVSFWAIYDIENSADFDWVRVFASSDDFATQSEIALFNGEGNLEPWMEYSYSLGAFIGYDDVKVRFHFHSDGGYEVDGLYFDDFVLSISDVDDAPPYIGYTNPPAFYEGTMYDFMFSAELIDVSGIEVADVNYFVDGVDMGTVAGVNIIDDMFEFVIPAQDPGALVEYTITATDASDASNTITSPGYTYIAGDYVFYDDPEVAFYSVLLAGTGAAVKFSFTATTQMVTGLIRNYEDQSNPPNKNFMFHVWTNEGGLPGEDLITPFEVVPAATVTNPNPMTVVDLRDYMEELTIDAGDVFIGMMVLEDSVKVTTATLANNRSMVFDGAGWGPASNDYHFRLITNGNTVGVEENMTAAIDNAICFPNPAVDVLYISSKNEILNLTVISTSGQVVLKRSPNTLNAELKISSLPAGVYFVQVETVNGISPKKIIVE